MDKSDISEFIKKNKNDLALVVATLFFTVLLIVGLNLFSGSASVGKPYVPEEFSQSRVIAGGLADELANLTKDTVKKLDGIREADRNENYSKGIQLAQEAVNNNSDLRRVSVSLSEELKNMSVVLDSVNPRDARAIGVQAVTTGIELVQRMVNYNNYTYELLEVTRARLQYGDEEIERDRIEELISLMNEEANSVNNLSREYKSLMLQFDELTQQDEGNSN